MSKLIILEGPDCCGKTTLAKHLCRELNCTYVHCTASSTLFAGLEHYHMSMVEMVLENRLLNPDASFVFDRFWPSEVAYGKMLLRPDSNYEFEAIEENLHKINALYVWCFSGQGWNRYREGHEDPAHALQQHQYYQVCQNYREINGMMKKRRVERNLLYEIESDGSPEALEIFTKLVRVYATTRPAN